MSSLRLGSVQKQIHITAQKHAEHQDAKDIQKKLFFVFFGFFYLFFLMIFLINYPINGELPPYIYKTLMNQTKREVLMPVPSSMLFCQTQTKLEHSQLL